MSDQASPGEESSEPSAATPRNHAEVLREIADRAPDRTELRLQLARVILRRLPEERLATAEPARLAAILDELFALVDDRSSTEALVRHRRARPGVDARGVGAVLQVACGDRPFLLSTVLETVADHGLTVLDELHPILGVERGDDGTLTAVGPARTAVDRESVLHLELDRALDDEQADALVEAVRSGLDDVRAVTGDYEALCARLREVADRLRQGDPADPGTEAGTDGDPEDDPREVAALLEWLLDDQMVLLGLREYRVTSVDGEAALQVVTGQGLGLLTDDDTSRFVEPEPISRLPEAVSERLRSSRRLAVTRTTRRSTVQRRAPMEDLRVLVRDEQGGLDRVVRLLGLFTRKGLAAPAASTPVLRTKLRHVVEAEDVVPGSHDEITLLSLFEALPKDELLRAPTEDTHRTLVGLMHAEEHRELRTLVRFDRELGAVTVLITTPRDTWSPQLREQLESLLQRRYGADRVDVDLALGDRHTAVARFLLHLGDGELPAVPVSELQAEIRRLARPWLDAVIDLLHERVGGDAGHHLGRMLAARLPEAYRQSVGPGTAVEDVLLLDTHRQGSRELLVGVSPGGSDGLTRIKAAKRGAPLVLSAFLPILESLGLEVVEEVPYRLVGDDTTLHDFGVRLAGVDLEDARRAQLLADAVHAAWDGHLAVDSLNRLVLHAGIDWSDVGVVRAYRRYRRQVGTVHTPEYVNDVLVAEHEAAAALIQHFHARFDPDRAPAEHADGGEETRAAVLAACDAITSLDHDRIVRGLLHLVDATLRTNAFREDAVADHSGVPYLSLKLDPARVPDVPAPLPHREIFVFSPEVEGVHLRAGPVARGGLRWSERRDDVRTEVLDLVKAQIRKNSLIVPTGAKGGFVLRHVPDEPAELRQAVEQGYKVFVRGMLDVTDDREGDEVVPPDRVVRHDGDDPYLVVAADRGTATLSDTANALAARYGFWLDDAFASGGSNGYDHKELGVTAKGAWMAIRRHFRELDVDIQRDPVTVVGVGDMSGDVFGNGMLLSDSLRLVAAFDHRHVFLDPDPDPAASFAERRRLFDLPRSSWADYDPAVISEGGGVFSRAAKSVPISPQVRELLRVDEEELSPPQLLRAVLTAPVDLLFAGGIGTYVKAPEERHEEVGDRTNDEIRVDADRVRARMIGEGANLFITQRARIAYARRGGRADQDAVHNAAGVATSDREVNLKILLNLAVEAGRIDDEERTALLRELSGEVVDQVMGIVDSQTAALSRELAHSPHAMGAYQVLLDRLDDHEAFDRDVEVLPDDQQLAERAGAGAGLSRPELSTLLAWAKRDVKAALLASDVPDQPVLAKNLPSYFPPTLVSRFSDLLEHHPLRRELLATVVTNELVDRMGVSFASTLADERGTGVERVVLAWEVARQILDADHYQELLDGLEGDHDPERVLELQDQFRWLLSRTTQTLLLDSDLEEPEVLLARDQPVARELIRSLLDGGSHHHRARVAHARWLVDDLVPEELARLLACARDLVVVPDVAVLTEAAPDRSHLEVADLVLRIGELLGIDDLERVVERVEAPTGWARRQRRGLETDLRRLRRDAATSALELAEAHEASDPVEALLEARSERVTRARRLVERVGQQEDSLDALAVATRALADVTRPGPIGLRR